ncbi:uncharacterized protein LOC118206091 [Stegodyphus dumicola]|uniref:uncharacterized protein LOC118206091 n=1 Tax=Stegodyphus dumicola TaxID=202533 RepID=UPI0015AA5A15|nr:uncharacterized protein LOC118206091 [Stegodyphus dumicola]
MAIQRRFENLSDDVTEQLQNAAAKFSVLFSSSWMSQQILLQQLGFICLSEEFLKILSITTDGAPAMIGIQNGMVILLGNHLDDRGKDLLGQFKEILEHPDAPRSDLVYYSGVRWLSHGEALKRFADLIDEIIPFIEGKGKQTRILKEPSFKCDLAFLVDVTAHLNDLNKKLMGKTNSSITWRMKYSRSPEICKAWDQRDPFSVVKEAAEDFQIELIDLQNSDLCKSRFCDLDILDFYRTLPAEFLCLKNNASRCASMFGSTYICEQTFSLMNLKKSKLRNKLTDQHVQSIVIRDVENYRFTVSSSSEDEDENQSIISEASGSSTREENSEKLNGKHDLEITDEQHDGSLRKKSRLFRPPTINKEDIIRFVEDAKKQSMYGSDNHNDESNEDEKNKKENLRSSSKTKQRKHHRYRSSDSDSGGKIKIKYPRERSPCSSKTRYKYYPEDASVYGESSRSLSGARSVYDDDGESVYRGFGSYFCEACQLNLNSEVTFQTHMEGKRHKKNEKHLEELALTSIADKMPDKLLQASGQAQRYPVNERSVVQNVIDDQEYPCPGVSYVTETRMQNGPPSYKCNLCDAQLSIQTLMPHLKGFKHLLACLERYEYSTYRRLKDRKRSHVEEVLREALERIEHIHGRGVVRVEEELQETEPSYDEMIDEAGIDPSRPDFYCALCDAHMNNKNMWQAHITGKRHLKNMRKQAMSPAQKSSEQTKISSKPAKLMSSLAKIDEPIVGLDYIRETQIPGIGENYSCFLCGASCSSKDIIEHLLLTKHRRKYLEIIKHPDFQLISSLQMSTTSKDPLIIEACRKALLQHGPGKIEVVIKHS